MAKFRVTATVVWDMESDLPQDKTLALVKEQLDAMPIPSGMTDVRLVARLDKLKEKIQRVRLGEFKPEDVIPYITKEDHKREYEAKGEKFQVRMNSHRYFIFRECMDCVACGLKGTRMFLEYHPADKSPHFNLYGEEDGKLILMTKDHIHAKAFGGEDRHSNYQTMCIVCNNLKGHANLTLDGVRELRQIYDENKNKVTKKKLNQLLEDAKSRLSSPWPGDHKKVSATRCRKMLAAKKASAEAVLAACDLNVYEKGGELFAKSVYEVYEKGETHVACIRKGTSLEPLVAMKGKVLCKFCEEDGLIIPQSLVKETNAEKTV